MRDTLIIHVDSAVDSWLHNAKHIGKQMVHCRPEGYPSLLYRLRATWLVFTGKADALVWEDQ